MPRHRTSYFLDKRKLKSFAGGMGWVVAIALGMLLLHEYGVFFQWEMSGIQLVLGGEKNAVTPKDLLLVGITDADYKEKFGNTSPLKQEVLEDLILRAASLGPKIIVIDIDISDPANDMQKPEAFVASVSTKLKAQQTQPPILLWAQPVTTKEGEKHPAISSRLRLTPDNFSAVPLFPRDRDGIVRSYVETVEVLDGGKCERWPTLPHAATLLLRGGVAPSQLADLEPCSAEKKPTFLSTMRRLSDMVTGDGEEHPYLDLNGNRHRLTQTDATSILDMPAPAKGSSPLTTVIIGGNYAAARDEYFTAQGPVPGMQLIAFALDHQYVESVSEGKILLLDLVLGMILVGIGTYVKWHPLLCSVAAGLVLPYVLTRYAYHSQHYILNFVPVVLGTLVHIVVDERKESRDEQRHMRRELHSKEDMIGALRMKLKPQRAERVRAAKAAKRAAEAATMQSEVPPSEPPPAP